MSGRRKYGAPRSESGQSTLVEIGMTLLILGVIMAFLFSSSMS